MSENKVVNLATKTHRTQDWTPVQMLNWLVDGIESGEIEEPDSLVVVYMDGEANESGCTVGSYHARASGVLTLSMFEMVKHFIVRDIFGGD